MRNPSTYLRRGSYIYKIAQDPITKEAPEGETDEEFWKRFYEKHVEELEPAYESVVKAAKKIMDKAGLKASLLKEGLIQTKDGVDLIFDVEKNLPGGKLRFDYTVGWLNNIKQFFTKPYFEESSLNEIVFEYCNHSFVANRKDDISSLLKTLAFLQMAETRPREDLGKLSNEDADKFDYALGLIQSLINRRGYKPEVLEDKDEALKALKSDAEFLRITDAVLNAVTPIIQNYPDQAWKEKIQEFADELVARKYVPSRELVENKVMDLTRHEKYSGNVKIDYAKDGSIVAVINAPYPFIYIFSRHPGGRLDLSEAAMQFCQQTVVANNDEEARKLITANLDLAQAYATAANTEDEGNTKPAKDLEGLVEIFQDLHREDMIKFLQTKFPNLKADDINKLLKQLATRGFNTRVEQ